MAWAISRAAMGGAYMDMWEREHELEHFCPFEYMCIYVCACLSLCVYMYGQ